MGFFNRTPQEKKEAKIQSAHTAALREDINIDVRKAERAAYRKEAVKVAAQRGAERARRPSGFAGFATGLQNASKGMSNISSSLSTTPMTRIAPKRRTTKRKSYTKRNTKRKSYKRVIPRSTRAVTEDKHSKSMLNFRF